jgi:hypothetical protein
VSGFILSAIVAANLGKGKPTTTVSSSRRLKAYLESFPDMQVVGVASSGEELLARSSAIPRRFGSIAARPSVGTGHDTLSNRFTVRTLEPPGKPVVDDEQRHVEGA